MYSITHGIEIYPVDGIIRPSINQDLIYWGLIGEVDNK